MELSELQDIFDQSRDVIALFDSDLRYVLANTQYCRYWDVEREDVIGTRAADLVGRSGTGELIIDTMKRCLGGENVRFEQWIDFPGAGRRFMDGKFTPRLGPDGEVAGVLLISRDMTRRRELEAAVKSERDLFDNILSSINVGVVLFNRDMEIEWANRAMMEMYDNGDPRGRICNEYFSRQAEDCFDCPVRKTRSTGRMFNKTLHLPGSDIWRSFSSVPILDARGEVDKILGYDVDITELKHSLQTLEVREAELASILRVARAGIGMVRNRIFIEANDFFFNMIGYERDEVIGKSSRMVYDSDEEFDQVGKVIYRALRGRDVTAAEARWIRKDGTPLDVLITLTPMHPERPEEGATFVAMDITEYKRAEYAIRESERRFRRIFEGVDVIAVQGYDEDRKVTYWNPASERVYGYTREEAMGRRLEELIIPEEMHEAVKAGHKGWLDGGPAIPPGELELLHKDGSIVPVYSSHVMQETALGEKIMYCVDVDMTEFKRIRNRLVQAKEEAEAANKAKSEFLANMSHEIRTPLNGIQGMLSLLLLSGLEGEQKEFAEAGKDSAIRLNRLLSDILDLSRVEAGKLAVLSEPFDLPDLVKQVCELFQLSFEEAGIDLVRRVGEDTPRMVVGDGARVQQILTNLVGNALKYTDSGGVRVEVSRLTPVEEGRERILFSVFDTGIGISREVLDSLFKPFVQGSMGYSRQYQGAGLGLSICKRLVDLMGGNMSVESSPGEGSAFHVVLQFGSADNGTMSIPVVAARAYAPTPLRVLLAEDDRVNRIVGRRLLEGVGCSVAEAINGHEALEQLRGEHFDAVFMDVQMPGMDGVEATRVIRNGEAGDDRSDVPIFAMTAYTMAGDRERFMDQGLDGYIPKPVEMEDVMELLDLARQRKKRRSTGSPAV